VRHAAGGSVRLTDPVRPAGRAGRRERAEPSPLAAPPPLADPPALTDPPAPTDPPALTELPGLTGRAGLAEPLPRTAEPLPPLDSGHAAGAAAPPSPPADDAASPPANAAGRRAGSARARRHRAAPAGRQRRGAAYFVVLGGVALSLSYMWRGPQNVRGGTLALAGMLLAAAVARLVLPERRAGMLASRRRLVDVATFAVLGVALLVAGLVFPAQN
jgi:Protein of unknown function (DUF3017)